jgi:hypothetical protein
LIKKLGDEFGIPTEVRVASNDSMKWLQIDQNNNDFLFSMLDKSYYLDDDYMLCYGQLNYGLVCTTLNTELKNEVIYETIYSNDETINDSPEMFGTKSKGQDDDTKKILIYFNDFQYHDPSPIVNKINSNALSTVYSDGGELVDLVSKLDVKKLSTNSFKIKTDVGKLAEHINRRNITTSVHKNYYRAMIQNMKLKNEYFTSHLALDVKPRHDYKLMQKVQVSLPSQASSRLDYVHSGEYLIGGIVHTMGSNSILSTRLYLYRNGVNTELSSIEKYETKLS